MKRLLLPVAIVVLGGCSSELDELKAWVREQDKAQRPKVEQLPVLKAFEPFSYEGFDLPDPFKPRKLTANKEGGAGGGLAPDLNRRKEPLEAFPLEQLKMVGTLSQGPDTYALVRADKTLYRVKKGNYMGQNFGLITEVTENANTRSLLQKGLSYAFGDGSSTVVNLVVFTLLLRYLSPAEFNYLSIEQTVSS